MKRQNKTKKNLKTGLRELREKIAVLEESQIENKHSAKAFYESEEQFHLKLEGSSIGMAIIGLDYKFLKVNETFCEMLGYTEKELAALTFVDITYPGDTEKDIDLAEQLFMGKILGYEIEKRCMKNSQEILWINLKTAVIHDRDEQVLYGLALIEDITEQRQEEMHKERGEKFQNTGTLGLH